MKKTLGLTGVTGKKSGRELITVLSKETKEFEKEYNSDLRIIGRETSDYGFIKEKFVESKLCKGDFNNFDFLCESLKGVDVLIHIAGRGFSVNIAKACVVSGVKRVIFVQTTAIYSKYRKAGEVYRQSEKELIKICLDNDISYTILRPTMIYGNIYDENICTFIKMVDKLPIMPIINKAKYKLQPIHYKDLAKAYYLVLKNEAITRNKEYNLSGKEPICLCDLLNIIGKNLNKKIRFINIPLWLALCGAYFLFGVTFGKKDYREKVKRLCEDRNFSYSEAKKDFGFNPIEFEEGIVDEVAEYKKIKSNRCKR